MKRNLVTVLIIIILAACSPVPNSTSTQASTKTPTETEAPTPTPLPIVEPWGSRQIVSFDGAWQFVKVNSLDEPIPTSAWKSVQVPGVLLGFDYERAWFQRNFNVPSAWQSRRLIVHFGGVKYNSRVVVNGQEVGGHFNGYDAFDVDITNAVNWGESNRLQIGVTDWTGLFTDSSVDLQPYASDWEGLRLAPEDLILSPIGGLFTYYGIWDSVYLEVVPLVHIESFFIRPSIRENRLEVDVTITNDDQSAFKDTLEARIFPWHGGGRDEHGQWILQGEPVATIPEIEINLEPGQVQTFTLSLSNPQLETWSPNSPQLYILEFGFDQPAGDGFRERFGWREFWVENGDFYLNGNKVHLLASAGWPDYQHENRTKQEIIEVIHGLKEANVVAFRTHTQPWQEIWYEAADEAGMLMIPEGAIWNDDTSYRINDDRFWNNYADHLTAMVENLRNHPSVVMWSLENELTGTRVNDQTPTSERYLADEGLLVKDNDPTRPITYESDGDPGGVTDVIGLHYPNEYPEHRLWPQDAYWLDDPRDFTNGGGGGFFWDNQPFLWDHQKPLYIGEYMWEPSNDPSTHTVLLGDEAYISHSYYRTLAKAFAWRMQMLAYRYFDVSGHTPWTLIDDGMLDSSNPEWLATRDMYQPLAAFLLEYDSRFYSGEKITRTAELFNDFMMDLPNVNFRWTLLEGNQVVAQNEETLSMLSGDRVERLLEIPLPQVDQQVELSLRLSMGIAGEEKFSADYQFEVFPRGLNIANLSFNLYDPLNNLAGSLRAEGADFTQLQDLQSWDGEDILVIAPGALSLGKERDSIPLVGTQSESDSSLYQKVQEGGRVVVLEANRESQDMLPLKLSNQQSTLAFIQAPLHPILVGLTNLDFRWWRGDNLVSINEPVRTGEVGIHPLIVTGNDAGISHAPLVEIQQGEGLWIISQLQIASKLQDEPMAKVLFERIMQYIASYKPSEGKTVYYPADLDSHNLGANWELLESWDDLQYPAVYLLVLGRNVQDVPFNRLRDFLEDGGTVLWDQPPQNINPFLDSIQAKVQIETWNGPAFRLDGPFPLLDYLTREDLYWIGTPGKHIQDESEIAPNATAIFVPEAGSIPTELAISASTNAELEGEIIRMQGNEILMATNGSASWDVSLPQDGLYQFVLLAYGTTVDGIYPTASVLVDGMSIGTINIDANIEKPYRLYFTGSQGSHKLSVAFTNDEYQPPQDRNLTLSRYLVSPAEDIGGAEILTSPAALINIPIEKGKLILSTINWDMAGSNTLRGQRYFASLLTGLGVRFNAENEVLTLEAESLVPMPDFAYFESSGGNIKMNTNGYVQGEITVAQAGRYRIGLMAKGTPVAGIYPTIQIELGGSLIGVVDINSGGWELHNQFVDLPEGTFNLRLRFVNDAWRPEAGEDRNVAIDWIEFEAILE